MQKRPNPMQKIKPLALSAPSLSIKIPQLTPLQKGKAFLPVRDVEFAQGLMPLVNILPIYPRKAKIRRIEGYVKVGFTIDVKGRVKDPFIIEAKPKRIFNKAALKAIKKWKFRPQKNSQGVVKPQKALQIIEFKLQ